MSRTLVVGGAILDDLERPRRVLVAHRQGQVPGWELPGGKVEAGEVPAEALERELREELGIQVLVDQEVPSPVGPWPINERLEMRVYLARLEAGEPRPVDGTHDRLEWVSADGLLDRDWLPADVAVSKAVRDLMVTRASRPVVPGLVDVAQTPEGPLRLRRLQPCDAVALAELHALPEVVAALGHGVLTALETELLIAERCAQNDAGSNAAYAVLLGDRVVGEAGIRLRPAGSIAGATGDWEGSMGYSLLPAVQGRGWGTLISGRLLGVAFDQMGLRRVKAEVFDTAAASMRVMEKVGMREEGRFRSAVMGHDGQWLTDVMWALTREEWDARGGQPTGQR